MFLGLVWNKTDCLVETGVFKSFCLQHKRGWTMVDCWRKVHCDWSAMVTDNRMCLKRGGVYLLHCCVEAVHNLCV